MGFSDSGSESKVNKGRHYLVTESDAADEWSQVRRLEIYDKWYQVRMICVDDGWCQVNRAVGVRP